MVNINNSCSSYYTIQDICQSYAIDKNKLLEYLRQKDILHSQRYVIIANQKRKNNNYNLPKQGYDNLFKIKKQRGKNGFINYKLLFTEQGKSFVGQVISMF